jgi:hypothetical protein
MAGNECVATFRTEMCTDGMLTVVADRFPDSFEFRFFGDDGSLACRCDTAGTSRRGDNR